VAVDSSLVLSSFFSIPPRFRRPAFILFLSPLTRLIADAVELTRPSFFSGCIVTQQLVACLPPSTRPHRTSPSLAIVSLSSSFTPGQLPPLLFQLIANRSDPLASSEISSSQIRYSPWELWSCQLLAAPARSVPCDFFFSSESSFFDPPSLNLSALVLSPPLQPESFSLPGSLLIFYSLVCSLRVPRLRVQLHFDGIALPYYHVFVRTPFSSKFPNARLLSPPELGSVWTRSPSFALWVLPRFVLCISTFFQQRARFVLSTHMHLSLSSFPFLRLYAPNCRDPFSQAVSTGPIYNRPPL